MQGGTKRFVRSSAALDDDVSVIQASLPPNSPLQATVTAGDEECLTSAKSFSRSSGQNR